MQEKRLTTKKERVSSAKLHLDSVKEDILFSDKKLLSLLKHYKSSTSEEKKKILDSVLSVSMQSSPLFVFSSFVNLIKKNSSKSLVESSIPFLALMYNQLNDDIQRSAVLRQLDEIDKDSLVSSALISFLKKENSPESLEFILTYLYRGSKQLDKNLRSSLNRVVTNLLKTSGIEEQKKILSILSIYSVEYSPFVNFSRENLFSKLSDESASYLISLNTLVKPNQDYVFDKFIASLASKEAASKHALYQNNSYDMLAIEFLALKPKKREAVYKKLKSLYYSKNTPKHVKANIKEFFSAVNKEIIEKQMLKVTSLLDEFFEAYIQMGKLSWKHRFEVGELVKDNFKSIKHIRELKNKLNPILEELRFNEKQIKAVDFALENAIREIQSSKLLLK